MNSSMKSYVAFSILRRWSFALPLLAIFLISSSVSALLMRSNGPEPIIVQVKESLRLSDDLDNRLSQLEAMLSQNGLNVSKWCAGHKLLVMLSFPSNFTEQQAVTVIERLQQLPAVEKVVAASAFNLEFNPADFARQYVSNQTMPEAARRGLDRDEWLRPAMTQAKIDEAVSASHVPNQIIVRWKSRHAWRASAAGFLQNIADFHASAGAHVLREMRPSPTDLIQVVEFDGPGSSLAGKLRRYADCPWVDYAQPNYIYSSSSVSPNDPFYTDPGQPNLPQIQAPSAWGITQGDHNFVVAVSDSGANVAHPDVSPNLSSGARNFVTNPESSDVSDDFYPYYHGSNVAGIVGAKGNNGLFMTGVAWNVQLLILKVLDQNGGGSSERFVRGIDYAYSSNLGHPPAIAINCSWGLNPPSSSLDPGLVDAVKRARTNNMVVVAAAGNMGINSDDPDKLVSPASIPKDNVIAVGAVKVDDTKTNYSNYGIYRVELGAPGGEDPAGLNILGIIGLTQDPNSNPAYTQLSGTSMAAPHVTGAIQLVKSKYPWEDYAGLRDRVIMGTDDVGALLDKFRTGGRLNLYKALLKRTLIRNFSTRAKVESGDRIIIGGFSIGGPAGTTLKVAIRGLGPSLPPLGVPRLNDPKLQLNSSTGKTLFSNDNWGNLPPDQIADLQAFGLTPADIREAAMVRELAPGSYTVFLQSQDGQQGVALFEIWELSGNTSEQTRLRGISTRCPVGVGDEVASAGTIVGDPNGSPNVPKRRLLMRGRGPSLAAFGVPGVLADPKIELHGSTGALIVSNDQWRDVDGPAPSTGLEDKLIDAGLAPTCLSSGTNNCENESVLWPTLVRGTYTTILQGANNGTGIGLIEFFEY